MDSNLEGTTALITGACSSIGETTARLLAAASCNTVRAARHEDRPNDLARELGDHALPTLADVTDEGACEKHIEKAVERFGALDVLVNNAGLGNDGSVDGGEPENGRTMFAVKMLFSKYKTTRTALWRPADRRQRRAGQFIVGTGGEPGGKQYGPDDPNMQVKKRNPPASWSSPFALVLTAGT